MSVELTTVNYRAAIDPARGGAIVSAYWTASDGSEHAVLEPMDGSLQPFKAGGFAMVPFANRIAAGRFRFDGRDYTLPINEPEGNVAIHGFSREHAWTLTSLTDARAVLEQDFAQPGNPYRYHARQEISLSDASISIALSVRNDGPDAMPFGVGLHPWFPKTKLTTLAFAARGAFGKDARGLPVMPAKPVPVFDVDAPGPLGAFRWFDGCFDGWSPRRARVVRPEDGIAIDIEAQGALRHLHVFVPDDRPVVCAEPVSHAPDAINRPDLGPSGAMDVLAPGETLSGAMTLRAATHQSV